jgi:hypothetical protein
MFGLGLVIGLMLGAMFGAGLMAIIASGREFNHK